MQVLWLGRDVAGEDTTGAMGGIQMVQIEGLAVWEYVVRACRWVYGERRTACAGGMWLRWNTFTLHRNSINIWGVFIWVVAMRDKCELKMNSENLVYML